MVHNDVHHQKNLQCCLILKLVHVVQTMNSSAPTWIHSPWCTHITLTALSSEQISRFEVNLSLGSAGISSSPQTDTGFPHVPLLLISQPIWTDSKTAYTTPTLLWQADAAGAVLYFTVWDCSPVTGHWTLAQCQFYKDMLSGPKIYSNTQNFIVSYSLGDKVLK